MKEIRHLTCGDAKNTGELANVLEQLGASIEIFGGRCYDFLNGKRRYDLVNYGPYSARALLESSCTVLLSRVDPFRVLFIKKVQEQSDYDHSRRHQTAIQWSGDVIASASPGPKIWDVENKKMDQARALLSAYSGEIYWKPAFTSLLDHLTETGGTRSVWLAELQGVDPDGIVSSMRTEAERLYSSLSKGVHQEFVIPRHAIYDETTVKSLITRTIAFVVKLAAISQFAAPVIGVLPKRKTLSLIVSVETKVGVA